MSNYTTPYSTAVVGCRNSRCIIRCRILRQFHIVRHRIVRHLIMRQCRIKRERASKKVQSYLPNNYSYFCITYSRYNAYNNLAVPHFYCVYFLRLNDNCIQCKVGKNICYGLKRLRTDNCV